MASPCRRPREHARPRHPARFSSPAPSKTSSPVRGSASKTEASTPSRRPRGLAAVRGRSRRERERLRRSPVSPPRPVRAVGEAQASTGVVLLAERERRRLRREEGDPQPTDLSDACWPSSTTNIDEVFGYQLAGTCEPPFPTFGQTRIAAAGGLRPRHVEVPAEAARLCVLPGHVHAGAAGAAAGHLPHWSLRLEQAGRRRVTTARHLARLRHVGDAVGGGPAGPPSTVRDSSFA